jgi:acyl dehydratase
MLVFHDFEELRRTGPTDLGTTDWVTVDPEEVEAFATATRAQTSTPFLALSLTNRFLPGLLQVPAASSGINYGADRVRFGAALAAGDRVRARAQLLEVTEVGGALQTRVQIRVEVAGTEDPSCVVESLSRWQA